jgi:hypothetical protein
LTYLYIVANISSEGLIKIITGVRYILYNTVL